MTKLSRKIWFAFGIVNLGLGVVGAILPLLPAFPFLMLTLISFSKSSVRFHRWFLGTRLYRDNLQMYVEHHAMTWKVKIKVMITITFLMAVGFFMMFRKGIFIGDAVLCAVWIFHIIMFCFIIKTLPKDEWERLKSASKMPPLILTSVSYETDLLKCPLTRTELQSSKVETFCGCNFKERILSEQKGLKKSAENFVEEKQEEAV